MNCCDAGRRLLQAVRRVRPFEPSPGDSECLAGCPMSLPQTSLIICSRNRPALLAESVNSILAGAAVPTELLIIDQSDDPHPALRTLSSARRCEVRYLWTQSVGLSRANNFGIAAAHFDLLVFTHDDVVVTPTWFEAIVRAAEVGGPRGVVTGQVYPGAAAGPDGFAPTTKVDEVAASYMGRLDITAFTMCPKRRSIIRPGVRSATICLCAGVMASPRAPSTPNT